MFQFRQEYLNSSTDCIYNHNYKFYPSNKFCMRGADKSLARPTSRCRTKESIVSLERGVSSCTELQIFSSYRGWKEACQVTHAISTKSRHELSLPPPPVRQGAKGNSRHSERNIRGTCTIVCHRQNWVVQFKRSDFSTCDAPRPGRPKTVTTPEIIDHIHELILEDRRISAKSVAEQLSISRDRVGSITQEDLDMRKISTMWVPKCLNADQKVNGNSRVSKSWNFFGAIQMISCRDWWPWTKPGYSTITRR